MEKSETIGKLAEALAKAQGAIEGAIKDSTNPHFRSKYADLAAVWDACRKPLSDNGLAVVQIPCGENPDVVTIETLLTHASGEWVKSRLTMRPVKSDPQSIGSCITYARRYSLMAMVGVAPEDDDGNAASQPAKFESKAPVARTYELRPDEPKDVPEHFGMDEQNLDEAVLIADLKKAIADDMKGFSKAEKKMFYDWYMSGKQESVDVLQYFRDNYMALRAQYIEHIKDKMEKKA